MAILRTFLLRSAARTSRSTSRLGNAFGVRAAGGTLFTPVVGRSVIRSVAFAQTKELASAAKLQFTVAACLCRTPAGTSEYSSTSSA